MSCALYEDGTAQCWGNDYGGGATGLFEAGYDYTLFPSEFPGIDLGSGVRAKLIATGGLHTCAILTSGRIKCWGSNDSGQLGIGTTDSAIGDEYNEMGTNLNFTVID
jgi:alpha-tubulin suppressor-like RCC1 family protein